MTRKKGRRKRPGPAKSQQTEAPAEVKPTPGKVPAWRLWLYAGIILVVVPAVYFGVERWRRPPAAQLPKIDLTEVSQDVIDTIQTAESRVREDPQNGDTWGELGVLLFVHEFNAPAITCLEKAEQLDGDEFRWPYFLGVTLASQDKRAAQAPLERAAQLAASNPTVHLRLADLYFQLGDIDKCDASLNRVLQLAPQHPHALLVKGQVAFHNKQWPQSLQYAQQAARLQQGGREVHELLAKIHQRLGDNESAIRELRILDKLPGEPQTFDDPILNSVERLRRDTNYLVLKSEQYFQQGRYRESADILRQLMRREPYRSSWHGMLARTLIAARQFPAAAEVLDQAIPRFPESAELRVQRGALFLGNRQFDEAVREFEQAIEIKADYAEAYFRLGLVRHQQQKYKLAIAALQSAIDVQPSYADAYYLLAACQRADGDDEGAVESLRQSISLTPEQPDAYFELVEVLRKLGRQEEADQTLAKVRLLAPSHPRLKALGAGG